MKTTILFCLMSIFTLSIYAQQTTQWINCTSNSDVNDVVQHGDQLWLATTGGLVLRDLVQEENTYFNRGNSLLPSNRLTDLEVDGAGVLWLTAGNDLLNYDGTSWNLFPDQGGVLSLQTNGQIAVANTSSFSFWDGQAFTETMYPDEVKWLFISGFMIHPVDGTAWFSFYTFGVYKIARYQNGEWTFYDHTNSNLPFEAPYNSNFAFDEQQRIWLHNWSGLFYFEDEVWTNFASQANDFPAGAVLGASNFAGNQIWAIVQANFPSTETYLVQIQDTNQIDSYLIPEEVFRNGQVNFIQALNENQVYLGTIRNGCWKFENEEWSKIPAAQSPLLANEINQIHIDQSNVWMLSGRTNGNLVRSLFKIEDAENWTFFNETNLPLSLGNFFNPTILSGNSNDGLWFHTGDSLLHFQNNEWSVPVLPNILNDVEEINSFIHFEPDGKRWLLEKWQSLLFYESDQGWISFTSDAHGAGGGYYTDYFNHPITNDFWMASGNGISRYNGTDWLIIRPKDYGASSDWINNMLVTSEGIIWAAGIHTLFRIENEVVTVFNDESSPIHGEDIRSLALDAEEQLWVGMANAIAKFDGSDWIIFDVYNSGVPSGRIECMEFDEAQNLWIGSNNAGFAVYNPNGLPVHFLQDLHTTSTADPSSNVPDCQLFPNPLTSGQTIQMDSPILLEDSKMDCYSVSGQLLWTIDLAPDQQTIPSTKTALLSTGTYFLHLSNSQFNQTCPLIIK